MNKDKLLNIRIDDNTYSQYKEFCDKNGYTISKRIRSYILNDIKTIKK